MHPLRLGPIELDTEFGILSGPAGRHRLTGDPARILVAMLAAPGVTFSPGQIRELCRVQVVGGSSDEVVVKARISRCRSLLQRVGGEVAAEMLQTERSFGYRMVAPEKEVRLTGEQITLLEQILETHPDQGLAVRFRLQQFHHAFQENYAAARADAGANGIRLDPQLGLSS